MVLAHAAWATPASDDALFSQAADAAGRRAADRAESPPTGRVGDTPDRGQPALAGGHAARLSGGTAGPTRFIYSYEPRLRGTGGALQAFGIFCRTSRSGSSTPTSSGRLRRERCCVPGATVTPWRRSGWCRSGDRGRSRPLPMAASPPSAARTAGRPVPRPSAACSS